MQLVKFSAAIKPWYKSKIVLIALSALIVFVGMYVSGQGVTQTQIDVLQTAYPDIAQALDEYRESNNLFALVGSLVTIAITIIRVWYTTGIIPQSIKEE